MVSAAVTAERHEALRLSGSAGDARVMMAGGGLVMTVLGRARRRIQQPLQVAVPRPPGQAAMGAGRAEMLRRERRRWRWRAAEETTGGKRGVKYWRSVDPETEPRQTWGMKDDGGIIYSVFRSRGSPEEVVEGLGELG